MTVTPSRAQCSLPVHRNHSFLHERRYHLRHDRHLPQSPQVRRDDLLLLSWKSMSLRIRLLSVQLSYVPFLWAPKRCLHFRQKTCAHSDFHLARTEAGKCELRSEATDAETGYAAIESASSPSYCLLRTYCGPRHENVLQYRTDILQCYRVVIQSSSV